MIYRKVATRVLCLILYLFSFSCELHIYFILYGLGFIVLTYFIYFVFLAISFSCDRLIMFCWSLILARGNYRQQQREDDREEEISCSFRKYFVLFILLILCYLGAM